MAFKSLTLRGSDVIARRARELLRTFPLWQTDSPAVKPTTMDVWRPKDGVPVVLLRWLVTNWCNYRCPYCPQTHERRAPKGDGMTAHAFDNFPLHEWQDAFDRHFAGYRLSAVITGGEPMVDRKNVPALLNFLSAKSTVECIRIDTNASWKPERYPDLDRSKIILMCTFHPSHMEESAFMARTQALLDAGFKIGMVNYVMDESNVPLFRERRDKFAKLGVVLHPNPLWNQGGKYKEADLELMKDALPELDFLYRSGIGDPNGRICRYPALGYEMDYRGIIRPGCMPWLSASFFDEKLPAQPEGPIPCPHNSCVCLDKYSFLAESERNITTNPLAIYSDLLRSRAGIDVYPND
jgi:organic radical activating enzyme